MKKRILSLILMLALVCALLPAALLPANAESTDADVPPDVPVFREDAIRELPAPEILPYASGYAEKNRRSAGDDWNYECNIIMTINELLVDAIRTGKTTIDLSSYRIDSDVVNLYALQYYSPHIGNGIKITCWSYSDGIYAKIEIECPMSRSEVNTYFAQVEAKIAEIDAMLAAAPTTMEKALMLHDYLDYTCEYDYDNYLADTLPDDAYSSAGILMKRTGVCQGYAYAFMFFMNRMRTECHVVESSHMNHAWNILKLGEKYYHVDATWDDPTPDYLGMARHDYFLLSDSAISGCRGNSSNAHYGWTTPGVSCDDTRYDEAFWYGVKSPIIHAGDTFYFFEGNKLIKRERMSGAEYILQELGIWPVWGDSSRYWTGSFTGLWMEDDKLYYNSATELRCFDLSTHTDMPSIIPMSAAAMFSEVL